MDDLLFQQVRETGCADVVSLCRSLLREPGLVNRFQAGDRRTALCTMD